MSGPMNGPVIGFARVAVIGAGLIGGSIALRLREAGLDVVVVDPDARTRGLAGEARQLDQMDTVGGREPGRQRPPDLAR